MNDASWYIVLDEERHGPVDLEGIRTLAVGIGPDGAPDARVLYPLFQA